jgi:hypothetical protein
VFGDLRGRKLRSDRNAAAVDHHHALRTFPTTCLADSGAPFFAVTKVASRKASSQSSSPRWSIYTAGRRLFNSGPSYCLLYIERNVACLGGSMGNSAILRN